MGAYRFETQFDLARREVRRSFAAHIAVALFLCLTIIGAPIGVVLMVLALRERSRSLAAIQQAERQTSDEAQRRDRDARIRAWRSLGRS